MTPLPTYKKIAYILWWGIVDIVTWQLRQSEFMNTVGRRGAWIALPQMFNRQHTEDVIKKNRRDYLLEYGRYP